MVVFAIIGGWVVCGIVALGLVVSVDKATTGQWTDPYQSIEGQFTFCVLCGPFALLLFGGAILFFGVRRLIMPSRDITRA